jgi:hypothetical protein
VVAAGVVAVLQPHRVVPDFLAKVLTVAQDLQAAVEALVAAAVLQEPVQRVQALQVALVALELQTALQAHR